MLLALGMERYVAGIWYGKDVAGSWGWADNVAGIRYGKDVFLDIVLCMGRSFTIKILECCWKN